MKKSVGWLRAPRLLAEGVVVVASILVAFALDAWWADRQLRSELFEELSGIDRDLAANVELVGFQIDIMRRKLAAGDALVGLLEAHDDGRLVAVPDTLGWWALDPTPTLNAYFGGIDALIASGRLPAIENPLLRLRLTGLRGMVEDAVEEQLVANELQENRLRPLVEKQSDLASLKLIGEEFWAGERVPGRAVLGQGSVQIPSGLDVRNAILRRGTYYVISIGEMESLIAQLGEIRRLIGDEVGAASDPDS